MIPLALWALILGYTMAWTGRQNLGVTYHVTSDGQITPVGQVWDLASALTCTPKGGAAPAQHDTPPPTLPRLGPGPTVPPTVPAILPAAPEHILAPPTRIAVPGLQPPVRTRSGLGGVIDRILAGLGTLRPRLPGPGVPM